MNRYVIIGNGVAGTTAAEEIRMLDDLSPITLLSDEDVPFYYRTRLPEMLADEVDESRLLARNTDWYWDHGVDLYLNCRVPSADAGRKTLTAENGQEFPYDVLLLANGSHAILPSIPGSDIPGVFTLRSIMDARKIRTWAGGSHRTVLVGGGLLGLEIGNALRKLGKQVSVVEYFPRLLPRQLDTEGSERLQAMLEDMGFSFQLGATAQAITGKDRVQSVELQDGQALAADMVLFSAGVRPNLNLAMQLGLATNSGVCVDDYFRTSASSIFAAGDVAEWQGRLYGIWPAAMEQGRLAGRNMAGHKEAYQGTVMANILKIAGIDLASAGEIDAENAFDSRIKTTEHSYRKIVLQGNTIIGCIMLGNTQGFFAAARMIRDKTDVSGRIEALLSG